VKGRKRQVMVDTDGRGLILAPQPADVQGRDGAPPVLLLSRCSSAVEGPVSHARVRRSLPSRRFRNAPHPPTGPDLKNFEPDSQRCGF